MQNELMNNAETAASQELFAKFRTLVEQYKELMIEKNVIPQQTAIKDQQIAIKDQQIAALLQQYKLLQPLAPKLKQAENAAFSPAEVQQLTDTYTAAKQFVTSFVQLPPAHKERLANLHKQSEQVIEVLAKCRMDMNAGRQGGVQMVGKTAKGQNAPTVELISPASSPVQLKEETSYLVKAKVTSTGTDLSVAYTFTTDGKLYRGSLTLEKENIWVVDMTTVGKYGVIDVTITAKDSNGSGTAAFQYNRAVTPPTAKGKAFLDALSKFPVQTMVTDLATPVQDETANISAYSIDQLRTKLVEYEQTLKKCNYRFKEASAMQAYLTELNVTWDGLLSQCTWQTMSAYESNNKKDNPLFETLKGSQSLGLGADWRQLMYWANEKQVSDALSPFEKEWKARVDIVQKNIELIRAAIVAWEQAEAIRQQQAEAAAIQNAQAAQAAAEAHLNKNAAPVAPHLLALSTELLLVEGIKNKYKLLTAADFSDEDLDKLYTDETKRKEFVDDVTKWENAATNISKHWAALGKQLSLHYAANTKKKTRNQIEDQTKTQIDANLLKLAEFKTAVGSHFFEVFNKLNNSVYRASISASPSFKNKKDALSKFNATTNTLEGLELGIEGIPVPKIQYGQLPPGATTSETMEISEDFAKYALAQQGAGDTHAISSDDVKQNLVGDCYFLGSMAGIAKAMPNAIYDATNPQNSIVSPKLDSKGSPVLAGEFPVYVVKLYVPTENGKRTRINVEVTGKVPRVKATITVGGSISQIDFNTYGADYKPEPLSSGRGEEQDLWVMLIEKAFAQVRGGYPNIESGSPTEAMAYLLGDDYTVTPQSVSKFGTKADLDAAIQAASIVQMSTNDAGVPSHLVKGHSYLLEHITTNGYMLRNPHNDGTSTTNGQPLIEVPFDDLKLYFDIISFTAK